MDHISKQLSDRYTERLTTPSETLKVQTHISICVSCRENLVKIIDSQEAFMSLHNAFAVNESIDAFEHLPYLQLEFLVDDKLNDVDREIAESHLSVCGECTGDVAELRLYRDIAEAPALGITAISEIQRGSFWNRLFGTGSLGGLAAVAAVLLISVLAGGWFLLYNQLGDEKAHANLSRNTAMANLSLGNQSPVANDSLIPSEVPPSTTDIAADEKVEYVLNDGGLTVDSRGNILGLEKLSPVARNSVEQALKIERVAVASYFLGGSGGVLMGASDGDKGLPIGLVTPIGKVVKEDQPVMRWRTLKDATSYSVAIVDDKFRVIAESGELTANSWKPGKPLPRGSNYSWQVTAIKSDGSETVSPSSPAPQARFRVVDQAILDDIQQVQRAGASHLALGVLYAKGGLKREARIEFEKLLKQNPNSSLARKLLRSVK